jgi:hypothetical protein
MVEPVRHRQTKEAGTDMFEPKATAPHLDSTDLNLLLSQRFGSTAPAPRRKVCQSQKYSLCFNGGIGIAKTGKPIEIGEFSPFPGERHVALICNLESARQLLRASSPNN